MIPATTVVGGDGPQPCLGMIVGEAPGRDEVAAGRPFAGASGKLLESALRSFGIAREEVYITNVVKEMPLDLEDKVRRPSEEEVDAWTTVLAGELEHTAAQAILALGRTASDALTGFPDLPFGSKVGNVYTAFHPSHLLYRGWPAGLEAKEWYQQLKLWVEAWRV